MSDLLEVAVVAHGGLDRWKGVTSIDVAASITGAIWFVKGKGDALENVRFEVDTTRELLTMDFVGRDKRSLFEPFRVVMQRGDGVLIDSRDDPERSFGSLQEVADEIRNRAHGYSPGCRSRCEQPGH